MSPVGKSRCKKHGYYRVRLWEYSRDGMGFWSPLRSSLAKQYRVMDVLTGAYTGKATGDATERKDSYTSFPVGGTLEPVPVNNHLDQVISGSTQRSSVQGDTRP